jgi:hypothetical protein
MKDLMLSGSSRIVGKTGSNPLTGFCEVGSHFQEAPSFLILCSVAARLKPCPDTNRSFSAVSEVVP